MQESILNPLPHYAQPNASTLLPSYQNTQLEAIRHAFQPTGFRRIQDIAFGETVCCDCSSSAAEAAGGVGQPPPMHVGTAGGGTFSDFAYMPSPFDVDSSTRRTTRENHTREMKSVGGNQPFCAVFNTFQTASDMHFEQERSHNMYLEMTSQIGGINNSEGDEEARRREKWIRDGVQFSKPFVPPGVQKTLSKPTRVLLGDAINALYRSIAADWPDAPPVVVSTVEDLIVVYFKVAEIRNEDGLNTYMNHLLRRNEAVQEYDLRKVPIGWHVATEDGHWLYTLRPPWVRAKQFVTGDTNKTKGGAELISNANH